MSRENNVGLLDRTIRAVLGLALLVLGAATSMPEIFAFLSYVLSVAVFVTAFTGVCPLYGTFGVDTLGKARQRTAS